MCSSTDVTDKQPAKTQTTQTNKSQPQTNKSKPQQNQKHQREEAISGTLKTSSSHRSEKWYKDGSLCAIYRAGHPLETTKNKQNITRMGRRVPKQKSHSAETRDPPSQDPGDRIVRPCRHDLHQCTSTTSICRASENEGVKRQ